MVRAMPQNRVSCLFGHASSFSPQFLVPPQAVVDLLVMRELLWSEARSDTLSFIHDCFSSINISGGRHQQHRHDWKRTRHGRELRKRRQQ